MPKTDRTKKRWAPRVCRKCRINHVENCPTCYGFGLRAVTTHGEDVPIRAAEAHGHAPLPEWHSCPSCGGSPAGHEVHRVKTTVIRCGQCGRMFNDLHDFWAHEADCVFCTPNTTDQARGSRAEERPSEVEINVLVGQFRNRVSCGLARCLDGPNRPRIEIEFQTPRQTQECYAALVRIWGGHYEVPNDEFRGGCKPSSGTSCSAGGDNATR